MSELEELRRFAEEQHWRVEERGGARLAWMSPRRGTSIVFTPNRANHGRDYANILADLRRAGLPDPETTRQRPRSRPRRPAQPPPTMPVSPAPAQPVEPVSLPATAQPEETAPMPETRPAPTPAPRPPLAAIDATSTAEFAGSVAELIEEEFRRRVDALVRQNRDLARQNDALREENETLRHEAASARANAESVRAEARERVDAVLRERGLL